MTNPIYTLELKSNHQQGFHTEQALNGYLVEVGEPCSYIKGQALVAADLAELEVVLLAVAFAQVRATLDYWAEKEGPTYHNEEPPTFEDPAPMAPDFGSEPMTVEEFMEGLAELGVIVFGPSDDDPDDGPNFPPAYSPGDRQARVMDSGTNFETPIR